MRDGLDSSVLVVVDGETLSLDQLVAVARHGAQVAVAESARSRVIQCRAVIERLLREGVPAYGVTTGFGALQDHTVQPDQLEALQENIILSHAAGVGPDAPVDAVRAMMLLRSNTFAKGFSGVRPELLDALVALVNAGITPVVPMQGSVGSSGDLAPLAHMASVLIGRGRADYAGARLAGVDALRAASLAPQVLQAKEGLALTNGTQFMTAIGALALADAQQLAKCADIALSLTLEALKGRSTPFREEIGRLRSHAGQAEVAENVRTITAGSQAIDLEDEDTEGKLQDAYSLRCAPQIHGASRDAFTYVANTLTVEMNSANDNPLVLPADGTVCSAGNFHGQPVALVLDHLALAAAELGNVSERRCARLLDPRDNTGLPGFLIPDSGLNSGLMIAQYTAAALVSEDKSLAHPASADSIPTSANQEDHNSMGSIAARHARSIVDNVVNVVAIEILCACQALDFRRKSGLILGKGTSAALDQVRSVVPTMERDRELYSDISSIAHLVTSGELSGAVESRIDSLH